MFASWTTHARVTSLAREMWYPRVNLLRDNLLVDIKASFHSKFLLFLTDIGPLLSHVTPARSKRQNSSSRRKSLEREQTAEPVKPAVPGGEPITLDVARVKKIVWIFDVMICWKGKAWLLWWFRLFRQHDAIPWRHVAKQLICWIPQARVIFIQGIRPTRIWMFNVHVLHFFSRPFEFCYLVHRTQLSIQTGESNTSTSSRTCLTLWASTRWAVMSFMTFFCQLLSWYLFIYVVFLCFVVYS